MGADGNLVYAGICFPLKLLMNVNLILRSSEKVPVSLGQQVFEEQLEEKLRPNDEMMMLFFAYAMFL